MIREDIEKGNRRAWLKEQGSQMRLRTLSIIQYQNITDNTRLNRLWLPVDAFRKQLEYLDRNDFRILSMDQAIKYMERTARIKKGRPISLTFDNGYLDFYEKAFPLLRDYGFPCTVLVSPPRIGESLTMGANEVPYLDWDMLRQLAREGMTIGAYEDAKWNVNDIPGAVLRRHIVDYKKVLEDRLGMEIRYFGVKEGVPSHGIRDLLVSEGYRAFLTECPTNRGPDLYSIGRIQVDDDDFNIFLTKISRTYLFFKDKRSWKYIREYSLDKLAHRISETYDKITSRRSTGSRP
jgi:peptidoglycan/xylan/chitin deacetylase (PgdA/CDA1 family)